MSNCIDKFYLTQPGTDYAILSPGPSKNSGAGQHENSIVISPLNLLAPRILELGI